MGDRVVAHGASALRGRVVARRLEDGGDGVERLPVPGLVGPKSPTVGVPIAADTCISPESLVTAVSAAASATMASRK